MCKHVAAALYGIGARLDEQPGLFFTLRQVEVDELITQTVQGATRTLLKKAGAKSSRVMEDVDLTDVFGIELDGDIELEEVVPPSRSKQITRVKPPPRRASITATASTGATFVDAVVTAIPRRRKQMSIADICARVDLTERQVRNAVARAVAQGRLRKLDRGIYIKP